VNQLVLHSTEPIVPALVSAGAAIAAAVDDALDRAGAVRQLPITPNRLHTLLADLPAA
jgi:CO/xanthine dehydrogenase Mo-binding subunit